MNLGFALLVKMFFNCRMSHVKFDFGKLEILAIITPNLKYGMVFLYQLRVTSNICNLIKLIITQFNMIIRRFRSVVLIACLSIWCIHTIIIIFKLLFGLFMLFMSRSCSFSLILRFLPV